MNAARRKELDRALTLLDDARVILEACKEEEGDAFDNLPQGLQQSDSGSLMESTVDLLDEAIDEIGNTMTNIETARDGS